jgi:alkylated DNA repair dioxygenase AlkB
MKINRYLAAYRKALPDAEIYYVPQWLNAGQADMILCALRDELNWQQDEIQVFGRWHKIPRLQAWHGDAEAAYRYSGKDLIPAPWTEHLDVVRLQLLDWSLAFNAVLANWYRNGHDKMGWHSDDERALGRFPLIASVSLGATRTFQLRHRGSGFRHDIELEHGSLLVMAGPTQHFWRHALPARKRVQNDRINLTFRHIQEIG